MTVHQSEFRRSMKKLRRHKPALAGAALLVLLYLVCLLAEFVAPYHYDSEVREHSYAPPSRIRFVDAEGKFHIVPFVYNQAYGFDQFYRRVHKEQMDKRFHLRLFVKGEPYKMWGLIPADRHLIGVEDGGRLYLMGADSRGRDLFSRIVYGSRVSLTIGLLGVAVSTLIGLMVGGISGYFGGAVDNVVMRLCEMVMLVPGFFLLLALRAAFPPTVSSVTMYFVIVLILSFIGWAGLARIVRGMVKSIRQREFVVAAEALGQNRLIIIARHVLPQTFSFLIVSITLSIPAYILGESGLSLIGLGIQDPHASWGNLLSDAMNVADIKMHPWVLLPGFFIFITVMAYNFLGDGLRDVFDPKTGT